MNVNVMYGDVFWEQDHSPTNQLTHKEKGQLTQILGYLTQVFWTTHPNFKSTHPSFFCF